MKVLSRAVMVVSVCALVTGCGGRKRVDTAKLATLQKVALVGVCGTDNAAWGVGIKAGGREPGWGSALLPGVAAGLDQTFPAALAGIQVIPYATASTSGIVYNPDPGTNFGCANVAGSPYRRNSKISYNPKPDLAIMKETAARLGVDAVVTVTLNPGYHFGRDAVQVTAGGINPVNAFVVDKEGTLILQAAIADVESDKLTGSEVERSGNAATGTHTTEVSLARGHQQGLGLSFGKSLGPKLAQAMRVQ